MNQVNRSAVPQGSTHSMRLPTELQPPEASVECDDPYIQPYEYYASCGWSNHTGRDGAPNPEHQPATPTRKP